MSLGSGIAPILCFWMSHRDILMLVFVLFLLPFRPDLATGPTGVTFQMASLAQLHPDVAPHVSHFSHVPFRTMVKLWHSEQELPV